MGKGLHDSHLGQEIFPRGSLLQHNSERLTSWVWNLSQMWMLLVWFGGSSSILTLGVGMFVQLWLRLVWRRFLTQSKQSHSHHGCEFSHRCGWSWNEISARRWRLFVTGWIVCTSLLLSCIKTLLNPSTSIKYFVCTKSASYQFFEKNDFKR